MSSCVDRAGVAARGNDALPLYDLGVLRDDQARDTEALAAYEAALACNPALAEGHYNLALLCEMLARPRDAIRHTARYR